MTWHYSEEFMTVVLHPTRWWDWRVSEDQEKEIKLFLTDEKQHQDIFSNF